MKNKIYRSISMSITRGVNEMQLELDLVSQKLSPCSAQSSPSCEVYVRFGFGCKQLGSTYFNVCFLLKSYQI